MGTPNGQLGIGNRQFVPETVVPTKKTIVPTVGTMVATPGKMVSQTSTMVAVIQTIFKTTGIAVITARKAEDAPRSLQGSKNLQGIIRDSRLE